MIILYSQYATCKLVVKYIFYYSLVLCKFYTVENYFIHLCALLARRAVNPCFPCLACHKNLPWEESASHTCIVYERADLNLLKFKELLQKKFICIVSLYYQHLVCDQEVLFDTFFYCFSQNFEWAAFNL